MSTKTLITLIAGIITGLSLPFITDLVLFGDITPCDTVRTYEDGSSIQNCKVRG